jgi:hypothetical protein
MQDNKYFDVNTFKMDVESYKEFLISDDDIDLDDNDEYNTDKVLVFHNKQG